MAGTVQVGDTGTITIGDATYTYTVVAGDTITSIETNLMKLINADPNSPVVASAGPQGFNIRLQAVVPGPDGNGSHHQRQPLPRWRPIRPGCNCL